MTHDRDARNRWERLREMAPADEAREHFEDADDPLGEAVICGGCKDDWPCDFERGRTAGAALAVAAANAARR